jgi:transcriptional regulator with XRE-family HTH domain
MLGWLAVRGVYPMKFVSYECCGCRLAAIRSDRGLTKTQLAAVVGVSRQAITRWEQSARFKIRSGDAHRIAQTLRCRRDDLLAPADAPLPPRPFAWPRIRRRLQQRIAALLSGGGPPRRARPTPMIALRS